MTHIQLSEKYVITMYEYLTNYCQLTEERAFQYSNFPHKRIKEIDLRTKIAVFPKRFFQQELLLSGIVLCVKDRSGQKLFYINPLLLKLKAKAEIMQKLWSGENWESLLNGLLTNPNIIAVPVTQAPAYSGTTNKKSYQKKIDYKRRQKEYEEY